MNAMTLGSTYPDGMMDPARLDQMNPLGGTLTSVLDSMKNMDLGGTHGMLQSANISIDSIGVARGLASGNIGEALRSAVGLAEEFFQSAAEIQSPGNDLDLDNSESQVFSPSPR